MISLINASPEKMILFFVLFAAGIVFILFNLKNTKMIYYLIIFYIPLSFRSLSGSLAIYLILLVYGISFVFDRERDYEKKLVESVIIFLLFIFCFFSLFTLPEVIYYTFGRVRISQEYVLIPAMLSSIALYFLTKRYVGTRDDFIKLFKIIVISGAVASLAGYLQLINPQNTYLFKYIVVAENPAWSTRIAATMPGYEFLAEYAILLILFAYIIISNTKKVKSLFYYFLGANFIIVLILSQTRGIFISCAFSMLYLIILLFMSGKFTWSVKLAFSSFIVLCLFVATVFAIDTFRPDSQFVERLKPENINIDINKGHFDTRTKAWEFGFNVIEQMTFSERIFGSGYKYIGRHEEKSGYSGWPHSLYLSYLIRDGVLGLVMLLTFLGWLYKASIKSIFTAKNFNDKWYFKTAIVLHMALIILIVDGIKIEFIRHDRSMNIVWLFFGIISVFSSLINKEAEKQALSDE